MGKRDGRIVLEPTEKGKTVLKILNPEADGPAVIVGEETITGDQASLSIVLMNISRALKDATPEERKRVEEKLSRMTPAEICRLGGYVYHGKA